MKADHPQPHKLKPHGNGNYLGQSFIGVQPCPKCHGKGFLNPDGSPNNAFDGSDYGDFIPCPDCQPPASSKASGTHAAAGKAGVPVLGLPEQAMLTANALRNIAEEINPDRNDVLRLKSAMEQLHAHADDLMRAVSVEKE